MRRRELAGYRDLEAYRLALNSDANQLELLYSDLLIEVTAFFRDAEAFEKLRTDVIPRICEPMSNMHQVRIWVPGCASGEEPYSLAILVAEYAREPETLQSQDSGHRYPSPVAGCGIDRHLQRQHAAIAGSRAA